MTTFEEVLKLADEIVPQKEEPRDTDITLVRYMKAKGVSDRSARRAMKALVESGKFQRIECRGESKYAWRLIEAKKK